MQARDTVADDVGKVIGVGKVAETKSILELLHVFGILLVENDVVDHVGKLLGGSHAVLGGEDAGGLVVLPVVIDGLSDTRRGDGSPVNVGVQLAQEGNKGTSIGASVGDVRSVRRCQIQVLKTGELDVLGKVDGISQRLVGGEEAQVLRAEVGSRQTLAVVAMFKDNTDTASRLGELVHDALLEELETSDTARLAGSQDNDGTTLLVVGGVEPVAKVEGVVGMRLVLGVIVEVVNGHLDGPGWVKQRRVGARLDGKITLRLQRKIALGLNAC